ncbi:MAG TPA: RNB domain-containing ribonuclease, partial [Solirubrobacterales bacterium]|nr:RNB domain-containing ribonuclease [Solirubrobacterales bacterium]
MAARRPEAARQAAARQVLLISRRARNLVGVPLFERSGEQLPIARGKVRVDEGAIALCRVDRRGAQPIADLGRGDRARDVVAALVAERGLNPKFPSAVESEAKGAIAAVARDPGPRRDLTAEPTFTVDPATARDFDDAVSARREGDGFRLWIHIADVAAHVRPGSRLDQEAFERANSTYAPGIVSPMLPRAISDDACSLNPDVERFAVTTELELKDSGETGPVSYYRSVIRSDARLNYEELDRIFSGAERAPESVAEPIAVARKAAAALGDRRRGGLELSGAEPEFEFTAQGHVKSARSVPETESHRLIERLMVLTNEQVARTLERRGEPGIYRVHEQPDPSRIELMVEQLNALDVPTPALPDDPSPSQAGQLAIEASRLVSAEAKRRGRGGSSLSSLVLRAMKPARYEDRNIGHAGLALSAYSHFTSPIRRYADLIAHRALLNSIGADERQPELREIQAAAERCSEVERDSMKIERGGDDICLAFLLQRELYERGQEQRFEGEVSGVVGAGAFVRFKGERSDAYEGFLPVRRIPDDRYDLNETDSALVGGRTGRRLGFGDPVEIVVTSIEAPRGRVDLSVPGNSGESRRRGAQGGGKRAGGKGKGKPGGKGKGKP